MREPLVNAVAAVLNDVGPGAVDRDGAGPVS
jgi:hypothetical protein